MQGGAFNRTGMSLSALAAWFDAHCQDQLGALPQSQGAAAIQKTVLGTGKGGSSCLPFASEFTSRPFLS